MSKRDGVLSDPQEQVTHHNCNVYYWEDSQEMLKEKIETYMEVIQICDCLTQCNVM